VSRPVAAIDCGTNAIRLLIADVRPDGTLDERVRLMRIVRLGEGVDRTGEFAQVALARTFAALDEFAGVLTEHDVRLTRFVATSASRDVSNREAFAAGVKRRIGVGPEVIRGAEEAALSFVGAVRGLPEGLVADPVLVVDIGGGSTEFVLGTGVPEQSSSVDVGCVRMTERHLHADPPTPDQIAAAAADIAGAVRQAGRAVTLQRAASFVGLAGTVTTVAAMALDLPEYDATVLHGSVIPFGEVARVTADLLAMTRAERATLPFMHPGRVDIIAGGAMVLEAAMRAAGAAEVIVSETDILDGIVYSLVAVLP
jgi:exopolyphosphatase/guanosine-5'-triphosphate,3'-diphosphate pyrophosphatase